jgi:alcohol dehydrogenase class IV
MPVIINVSIPDTTIGCGSINSIVDEVKRFGAKKILIITDNQLVKKGIVDAVTSPLLKAGYGFEIYEGCKPEPPISVFNELTVKIKKGDYDLLIGVGGGSNMDTTKVASVIANSDMTIRDYINGGFIKGVTKGVLPKILIPTTAGTGAEWSFVAVIYEDNHENEYVVGSSQIYANKVIIDPELTRNLPARITADTGIDALSHAIESFTAKRANFFSDMLAGTAIKMIGENILVAYGEGEKNMDARYNMSCAAALAMNAAMSSGLNLAHFMNEFLQTKAHVSHGTAVAILLPGVMEYNLEADLEKFARVAELLGVRISRKSAIEDAKKSVKVVRQIIKSLNLPQKMSEVGIIEAEIPEMAKKCYIAKKQLLSNNPRNANEADIAQIYKAAL